MPDLCGEFQRKYGISIEESQVTVEGNLNTFGPKKMVVTGLDWDEAVAPADVEFTLQVNARKQNKPK